MIDANANVNDEDLLNKLKSADPQQNDRALRQMYQLYYKDVEKFTTNNMGSFEDAKDIFQDAIVAIYKMVKSGKYPDDCPLKGYLIAICRNLLLKKNRHVNDTVEVEALSAVADSAQNAMEYLQTKEKSKTLTVLIQQLGEECKAILTSYYFENMSYKEICLKLAQVSEDSVKMKKKRCMARLREMIGENPALQLIMK